MTVLEGTVEAPLFPGYEGSSIDGESNSSRSGGSPNSLLPDA